MEELVGQRIRTRLQDLAMTHASFGEALAPYLGKAWSRSTVSVALSGGRAFTAAETLASALVLHVTPGWLLTPPVDVETIEFPSGMQVPRSKMLAEIAPLGELTHDALASLQGDLEQIAQGTQWAAGRIKQIDAVLSGAAGQPTYQVPPPPEPKQEAGDGS